MSPLIEKLKIRKGRIKTKCWKQINFNLQQRGRLRKTETFFLLMAVICRSSVWRFFLIASNKYFYSSTKLRRRPTKAQTKIEKYCHNFKNSGTYITNNVNIILNVWNSQSFKNLICVWFNYSSPCYILISIFVIWIYS